MQRRRRLENLSLPCPGLRESAWNFGRTQDRSAFEKRVDGDIRLSIESHERRLEDLESEIASWPAPPKARKTHRTNNQTDFFF
jgi:hypothetical protein